MSEHWFWTCREKFQQIAELVITFAGMGWVRETLKPMQASSNYAATSNVKHESTCEVSDWAFQTSKQNYRNSKASTSSLLPPLPCTQT